LALALALAFPSAVYIECCCLVILEIVDHSGWLVVSIGCLISCDEAVDILFVLYERIDKSREKFVGDVHSSID
jgi:hypothetical protein